jgi:hypothetical protein
LAALAIAGCSEKAVESSDAKAETKPVEPTNAEAETKPSSPSQPVEMQTISTKSYSCQVPAAWTVGTLENPTKVVTCPAGFEGMPQEVHLRIAILDLSRTKAQTQAQGVEERVQGYQAPSPWTEITRLQVAGIKATRVILRYRPPEHPGRQIQCQYSLYLPTEHRTVVFACQMDEECMKLFRPHLEALEATITIPVHAQ